MRASFSNYSNSSGEREGRLSVIKTNISESSIRWGSHREREGERGRCGGCEGGSEYLRLTTHKSHKINQGSEAQQTRTCCYSRVSRSSISLSLSVSLSLVACSISVPFAVSYGMFGAISDGR